MYMIEWAWDDAKNTANSEKHGVSFEEALHVFTDPDGIEKEDMAHSSPRERRFWRTGRLGTGRVITVVYARQGESKRLISAQERRRERREYERAEKERKG